MVLLTQTVGASAAPLPEMRAAIRRIDPSVPSYDAQTIEYFYATIAVNIAQTVLTLVAGIGLMGVAITIVGLYGLVSFSVNRRTREIGIRIAVGATPQSVRRSFLLSGVKASLVALALGLPLSIVGLKLGLSEGMIIAPGVNPLLVGIAIAPILLGVAAAATWLPARRASLVDPATTLRIE
jgi:ABC-type antimicrobial peptide transport system permease subunit